MKILAIETSCDDTSVAIIKNGSDVLSSIVSSQIDLHSKYGGVVPEVAARAHIQNMIPAIEEALSKAKTDINEVDYIAVTKGPGLIGSLIVGVSTARTLALAKKKPLLSVHHIEGHIYANWLDKKNMADQPQFPLVCLTVSGGHSNIIYMTKHLEYKILGETHDDSAGEAFDKVAKMLGLGYPGGPIISDRALGGDKNKFNLPRIDLTAKPQRNDSGFLEKPEENLDFSFSGLKTAVLREVRQLTDNNKQLTDRQKRDISASFQIAINETLTRNLLRAIKRYQPKSVLLSGGVAANSNLREMLKYEVEKVGLPFYYPKPKYCTDNAAMIGAAAYRHALVKDFTDPKILAPDSGFKLISEG